MTFRRSNFSFAAFGLALLATTLLAGRADAFTFEDKGAARNDDTSMFYSAGKSDPLSSRLDDGSGKKPVLKQGNGSFYFNGPSQSFDQRNNPNDYFSSDRLMGR
jgi:hypothetical protein